MENDIEKQKIQEQLPESIREILSRYPEMQPIFEEFNEINGYTVPHSINVAECIMDLGMRLGWDRVKLDRLVLAGLFHDLGKKGIASEIIEQAGELTPEQREVVDEHSRVAFERLWQIDQTLAKIIVAHHEFQPRVPNNHRNGNNTNRANDPAMPIAGEGNGSKRNNDKKTHDEAEVLAYIDQFEAQIARRPYRNKANSIDQAADTMKDNGYFSDEIKGHTDLIAAHYRRTGKYETN